MLLQGSQTPGPMPKKAGFGNYHNIQASAQELALREKSGATKSKSQVQA